MSEIQNPFFVASTIDYELEDFASIRFEHFEPAFQRALSEQTQEIAKITSHDAPADFENTIIALERSGQALDRVNGVFSLFVAADSTEELSALDEKFAPILSDHADSIVHNSELFSRIDQIFAARASHNYSPEQLFIIEHHHKAFLRNGSQLSEEQKALLSEYNRSIALASTRFQQHELRETNELSVVVSDVNDLAGLDDDEIESAKLAARDRGLDDGYLLSFDLPTSQSWLKKLHNRALRERIMRASLERGTRGGESDNRELILDLVSLRAKRAKLLGFDSHAAWVLAIETAKTPETVMAMCEPIAAKTAKKAAKDMEELAIFAESDGATLPLESWDVPYYLEKLRTQKFDVDFSQLRVFFDIERVLFDGVFFAANQLFGLRFVQRDDLRGYHPDVRVFEVFDRDGSGLGLYLADLYTRESKQAGAWMSSLNSQSSLIRNTAIVFNVLNVPKPALGETAFLTFDDTKTLFHEFGHALHGLLARVDFPSFAGTSVPGDFVEFPSQVNEMWMLWPEILHNYAIDARTGEGIDEQTIERIEAAQGFDQGFATSEYIAAALLDLRWHCLGSDELVSSVSGFEEETLKRSGLANALIPPRYSSGYFSHIFGGGYDAGYYSYLWSEVLDADTVAWFRENGGLTRENGDRFRRFVLGIGGKCDPIASYREFRGRDADPSHLLARRGLL